MLPPLTRLVPAKALIRSVAIALIATVMPFGPDLGSDGGLMSGAQSAYAKNGGGGNGNSGDSPSGADGDGQGGGQGGDTDENDADGADDTDDETAPAVVIESDGSTTAAAVQTNPGNTPSISVESSFQGSAEPEGPDLTINEEKALIARGWQ